MKKLELIPKIALSGIKRNKSAYLPYMLITTFTVFVFFIFNAISNNEIMYGLPYAMYIKMLMDVGKVLLAIILVPILLSTNQFLVKQRKNELGLYNVLGLDRKYISYMMFLETIIIYVITLIGGVLCGTVFSKLVYLFLLNITGLPIDVPFEGNIQTYIITTIFFGVVAIINLIGNLYQVIKAKPIELMKSSKKGDKVERFLVLRTLCGVMVLGVGYYIALITQVDSMIFSNFFFAVMLVIVGTTMLFKTGTILVLRKMKNTPKFYYTKNNFITVSGMLYRMKRNAQSLASICIFSTMIIVTLVCTVVLFSGQKDAVDFNNPMDVSVSFESNNFNEHEALREHIEESAKKYNIEVVDQVEYSYQNLNVLQEDNSFKDNVQGTNSRNSRRIRLISLEDYNKIEGKAVQLHEDEVLVFTNEQDFGHETLVLSNETYKVKEELRTFKPESKNEKNMISGKTYVIIPTVDKIQDFAVEMKELEGVDLIYKMGLNIQGEEINQELFMEDIIQWSNRQEAFYVSTDRISWAKDTMAMNGGLLFLGMFFGVIFIACVLLLMYYKQISEGFEDKRNFKILKQVGMSNIEVSKTIKKQVLMVFFLPLVVATIHTMVGVKIIERLFAVLYIYNHGLFITCAYGVIVFFAIIYMISYCFTGRAYYKIVK